MGRRMPRRRYQARRDKKLERTDVREIFLQMMDQA
jgi:hypothetical protein